MLIIKLKNSAKIIATKMNDNSVVVESKYGMFFLCFHFIFYYFSVIIIGTKT